VPQVLTNRAGNPNRTSMTLIMYLNNYLGGSKNYGMSGAISVIIFVITGLLSLVVYNSLSKQYREAPRKRDRIWFESYPMTNQRISWEGAGYDGIYGGNR
jgi:hypothetical protein